MRTPEETLDVLAAKKIGIRIKDTNTLTVLGAALLDDDLRVDIRRNKMAILQILRTPAPVYEPAADVKGKTWREVAFEVIALLASDTSEEKAMQSYYAEEVRRYSWMPGPRDYPDQVALNSLADHVEKQYHQRIIVEKTSTTTDGQYWIHGWRLEAIPVVVPTVAKTPAIKAKQGGLYDR